MARREQFEPYRLSPDDYAAWRASRPNPRVTSAPTIEFVTIGDTAPLAASVIEARIPEIRLGEPLDLDAVETALNRVYGIVIYQNVRYALVEDGGRQGLGIEVVERSWGPGFAQLGLRYSSASDEDARFGLAISYLRTGINPPGGEWRATLQLGDEPGFVADLYQPLGQQALAFVNPALEVSSTQLNVFENEELAAELKLRSATFELGVGRELMDRGEIRGGFRVGGGDTRFRVGDPGAVPYDSFHRGELFTRASFDTLDNVSFPRTGSVATVEWRGSNESVLGADHDYDQLLLSAVHARTWGRHTVLSTLRYDATISGTTPAYSLFGMGGFRDLSGLNSREITGQHATRLGASYYRRIGDLALFPAFVGFSVEVGNVWESRDDISLEDSIWGGALWAGVDTPAGPVFLAYGSAEGGHDAFYVFLGRLF
jgi:NTE family protein